MMTFAFFLHGRGPYLSFDLASLCDTIKTFKSYLALDLTLIHALANSVTNLTL